MIFVTTRYLVRNYDHGVCIPTMYGISLNGYHSEISTLIQENQRKSKEKGNLFGYGRILDYRMFNVDHS